MVPVKVAIACLALVCTSPGCAPHPRCVDMEALPADPNVLLVGDSVFDFNPDVCGDVGDFISLSRGARIDDRAVGGTWLDHPENEDILGSYAPGPWAWVIVDGGGNDLNEGCSCECDTELDALVSADTLTGAMPTLVEAAVADGARVILFGYYEPAPGSEFAPCDQELVTLSERYAALADRVEGVVFLDGRTLVSAVGDPATFHEDGIHLTPAGASIVADAMVEILTAPSPP